MFASGDRVMFLRNERSLGVKNGSLGTVTSVAPVRMSVMLDDGRSAAFDIRDYADIDHGYAATIHKAQGMTVDRTHVLATPGLDRHAAYVALSRHREGVELHYGRDDFADRERLAAILSRERGKDMAGDYAREVDRSAPTRRPVQIDMFERPAATAPEGSRRRLEQAIIRFAQTTREIVAARRDGLEESPHQRAAFDRARLELDTLRPEGARDLRAAFVRDMGLVDEVAGGNARTGVRVMDWERRYRTEPALRADMFVKEWRALDRQARAADGDWDHDKAARARSALTDMAKSLHRDPQLESLLRNRRKELGIAAIPHEGIARGLMDMVGA